MPQAPDAESPSAPAALAALRNLGPASARWLAAAGVGTPAVLRRLGAVEAFRRVAVHRSGDVSATLLYALAGAVDGRSWLAYTPAERAALRRAAGLDT